MAAGENFPAPSKTSVRVPRSDGERRFLKGGLVERNNEDISYVHIPLVVPSIGFAIVSVAAFIGAVVVSLKEDVVPTNEQMRRGVLLPYGSTRIACNSTVEFPLDGLPSILHLFERNVGGNVLFRIATTIPLVLRIFQSLCLRHMVRSWQKSGTVFEVTSDLMPALTFVETLSLSLFSIITIHSDFPGIIFDLAAQHANRFAKLVFAISAALNMLSTTVILFNFKSDSEHKCDAISLGVKMIATFIFGYLSPQYFQKHHALSTLPVCHSYIPRIFAIVEYILIVSYGLFHLTWIIDIRNVHFICYPRVCSGECEPLDPANFAVGGKYEHCRSYEQRQREVLEITQLEVGRTD